MTKHRTYMLFTGGLIFGTMTSIITKMQYDTKSMGADGKLAKFEKPWFASLVMFVGMAAAMPLLWYEQWRVRRAARLASSKAVHSPLLTAPPRADSPELRAAAPPSSWKTYFLISGPALFDLIASTLAQIGLLFTTVSAYQMLKGALLIFSAFLSVVYLKRRLHGYNWFGLFLCFLALAMVGASSLEAPQANVSASSEMFGIAIIVAGQLLQAFQFVVEERLLKDVRAPPLLIVGMEGVWGLLAMVAVFLPAVYFIPGTDVDGRVENTFDTFEKLRNSSHLQTTTSLYFVAVLAYNICGVMVTEALSAVHHTILDTLRTICVWAVDLFLFSFTNGRYGEAWTAWSWLQLAGFVVLVYGTAVYDGIVRIPGFKYAPESRDEVPFSPGVLYSGNYRASPVRASPVISKSVVVSAPIHDRDIIMRDEMSGPELVLVSHSPQYPPEHTYTRLHNNEPDQRNAHNVL